MNAIGYEKVTVSSVAVSLTQSEINPPSLEYKNVIAHITAEGGDMRYRFDGDPTATEGHLLQAGDVLDIADENLLNQFKAIRAGSTDGTIIATYISK